MQRLGRGKNLGENAVTSYVKIILELEGKGKGRGEGDKCFIVMF